MSKHIITEDDFVECPYCNKQAKLLHWKHLKMHGKKIDDVLREFPGHPTMTREDYEKKCSTSKQGAQASKETASLMKNINCIYCGIEIEVKNNTSNTQACVECINKGLDNPDGRTKDHANQAREKTLQKTYGKGVTNAAHVPGVTEKKIQTSEDRYGGIGFGSSYGEKCRYTINKKYGDENPMKTKEGIKNFVDSMKKKYGDSISNPMQILEVKEKAIESLTEYFKHNFHQTKGKTYDEIYGKEKAKELKEQRKISGLKGFMMVKDQFTSAPQKELFELVKKIYPDAKLEYAQFGYALDIAIPEIKLCIEYDGSYWHDVEHDKIRDEILLSFGWRTIRFIDKVPSMKELLDLIF